MPVNIGDVFGSLTVVERKPRESVTGRYVSAWSCVCSCGNYHYADQSNLVAANVTRCPDCNAKAISERKKKHGMTGWKDRKTSKIYYTWQAMKRRCYYEKEARYADYGGRGIKVCEKWIDSFEQFMADVGLPPTPDHTIERINNDGNYEPQNVRWATKIEQGNNKRNNHMMTKDGRTQTMSEWCRELGLSYSVVKMRLRKSGGDVEYSLRTEKVKKGKGKTYTVDGAQYDSLGAVASAFNMSVSGCHTRFKSAAFPTWIAEDDSPNY